ncbi:MAG: ABC transporter substrate-binding protein [Candidatus Hodarchaeales archaeon]|jgi:iron complex transport system substrate-binding protein
MQNKKKIVIMAVIIVVIFSNIIILNVIFGEIDLDASSGKNVFYDSLGRKVEVPKHPKRIISMAPTITEILFALEVDDRLYGVTTYCNYPVDVQTKTKIGGFSTPNIEIIVSLEPDLVFWAKEDLNVIEALEAYNITIIVIIPHNLDDVLKNVKDIGVLVDEEEKGKEVSNGLKAQMNMITDKTDALKPNDKLKSYFEVWETPTVAGGKSFLHDMIEKAGGINIFGDIYEDFPTVSHESVINENPDVIFVTTMGRSWYTVDVADRAGYDVIDAVINNRIYECDDDMFTRAGPRIMDALENMTRYLHPTLFT